MSEKVGNEMLFNKMCRICAKSYSKLYYLFETEAPSMLKFCGFLEVAQDDELPDKICEMCHNMLIQSYKLKRLCLSSKSYLQSLIIGAEENLNVNFEHSEQCEDDTSESEATYCSECQAHFSSKYLYNQHNCNNILKDDQSVLPSNECAEKNLPLQTEEDPDTMITSSDEDDDNLKKVLRQCPHCKIIFGHEQDAFVHLSIHSKDVPTCNVCKKTFSTMKILKRHIKIHMIVKSHVCKICHKGFPESAALLRHKRLLHLRLPRDKKYTCDECGQRFTDQYYLNLHRRKHTGEKPFECEICKKSFYDPRSYKVHMDVHTGVKPYLCSHCGKSFVQSAHLKQHLLVHTKEKPHTCNICNKNFTQSTSLFRHMKTHPVFSCNFCSKRFLNKKELLEHEENHNRENIATVEKGT